MVFRRFGSVGSSVHKLMDTISGWGLEPSIRFGRIPGQEDGIPTLRFNWFFSTQADGYYKRLGMGAVDSIR